MQGPIRNYFNVGVLTFFTGNPRTLFRGNSLAAKCMEQFMKVELQINIQ